MWWVYFIIGAPKSKEAFAKQKVTIPKPSFLAFMCVSYSQIEKVSPSNLSHGVLICEQSYLKQRRVKNYMIK